MSFLVLAMHYSSEMIFLFCSLNVSLSLKELPLFLFSEDKYHLFIVCLSLSYLQYLSELISFFDEIFLSPNFFLLQKKDPISHSTFLELDFPSVLPLLLELVADADEVFIKSGQVVGLLFLLHNKNNIA